MILTNIRIKNILNDIGFPPGTAWDATFDYCCKVLLDGNVPNESLYIMASAYYDGFTHSEVKTDIPLTRPASDNDVIIVSSQ